MKLLCYAALALCFLSSSNAWSQATGVSPCATVMPAGTRAAIQNWSANPTASKTTAFGDTVAVTAHIVGTDQGTGYFPIANLLRLLCQTNERFQASGIQFQLQWPVRYLNNDDYYAHDFAGGYNMIANENVPGTVNVYFVLEAAGACGYFYPGVDGVVIANMCAGNNSTTLTHELGHYMGLPHTFYGWEDGQTPAVRERVIRTGPQANCSYACDGFCDTDADFISTRWSCPASAIMYDDLGVRYHPDSSLYMSYSLDVCQTRFSAQQTSYMQYVLANNRTDLLLYTPQPYTALDTPAVSYPVDTMWVNDRTIRWAAVPGADFYHVSIKRASGIVAMDTVVTGTSVLTTHSVAPYNPYIASITPMSVSNTCAKKVRVNSYYYSPIVNPLLGLDEAADLSGADVRLAPNPAGADGWTLSIPYARRGTVRVALLSPDGRVIRAWQQTNGGGAFTQSVSADGLASGLYFIRAEGNGWQWTGRAVVSSE